MDIDACVRAAAASDPDAQGALMARYVDLARRTARRLVDDQATARSPRWPIPIAA